MESTEEIWHKVSDSNQNFTRDTCRKPAEDSTDQYRGNRQKMAAPHRIDRVLLLLVLIGSLVIGFMALIPIVYPSDDAPVIDHKMKTVMSVMRGDVPPTDFEVSCWTHTWPDEFSPAQVAYTHEFCKDGLKDTIFGTISNLRAMMMGDDGGSESMKETKLQLIEKLKGKIEKVKEGVMMKYTTFIFIVGQIGITCIVFVIVRSINSQVALKARFISGSVLDENRSEQEEGLMKKGESVNVRELNRMANHRGLAVSYFLIHMLLAVLFVMMAVKLQGAVMANKPDMTAMMNQMLNKVTGGGAVEDDTTTAEIPTTHLMVKEDSQPGTTTTTQSTTSGSTARPRITLPGGFTPPPVLLHGVFGGTPPSWALGWMEGADPDTVKSRMAMFDPAQGGTAPEGGEGGPPAKQAVPPTFDMSKTAGEFTCNLEVAQGDETTKEYAVQCHYRSSGSVIAMISQVMSGLGEPDLPPIPDKPPSPVFGLTFLAAQFDVLMCMVTVIIILIHLINVYIISPYTHRDSVSIALKQLGVKIPSFGYRFTNLSLIVLTADIPKVVRLSGLQDDDSGHGGSVGSPSKTLKDANSLV